MELAQPPELVARLEPTALAEERERAARLAAASRWIVARAALRIVLGGHLGLPAADVEFTTGPTASPSWRAQRCASTTRIPATARSWRSPHGVEVGVDVERTGPPLAGDRAHAHRRRARGARRKRPPHRAAADLVPQGGARQGDRRRARLGARGVRHERARGPRAVDLELDEGYVGALAVAGERPPSPSTALAF